MASSSPDPQHPIQHSQKANSALTLAIGLIGGLALFFGILYWYTHDVVNGPAAPPPNVTSAERAKSTAVITLDTPILEIEPLAEMHVKIVNGVAESIEPLPDTDVSAKLTGQDVTVTAAKDAKEGTHLIKIHGAKGQETILKVTVKKK